MLNFPSGINFLKMKTKDFLLLVLLFFFLSACTAEPQQVESCVQGEPAGFFMGIWHGVIAPITFILSIFFESIEVYAKNNTGGWYDLGFLIGVGAFSGGAGRASRK